MKDWLSCRCRKAEAGSWELREGIRARVSELRAILDDREAADAKAVNPDSKKGKLLSDARDELRLAEEKKFQNAIRADTRMHPMSSWGRFTSTPHTTSCCGCRN
ncbi:hypothetical protein IHE61_05140 [Streptomyces sp. GKU 257-1]|nr:hypothetical protein [Streptomyces sp. GKU 257-1]